MPRKNPASMFDAAELWQKAVERLEEGIELRWRVKSYGYAVNIRQKCYSWRKKQLQLAAERIGEIPGMTPSTPYDVFSISIRMPGDKPVQPGENPSGKYEYFDLVFYTESLQGEEITDD